MRQFTAIFAASLALLGCQTPTTPEPEWRSLFDGATLDGWMLVHGDKPYEVIDGAIVGTTALGIPNRYLTTVERFDDFILELEVDNSNGDNSGIQFRSVTDASWYAGLTGYQFEIDHTSRRWHGGIYFEGVGEWRARPEGNQDCQNAWRDDDWNRLRIEALGQRMRTYLNGQPCVELYDDWLSEGHIGLQIHSVGQEAARAGKSTRWRNVRIISDPAPSDYWPDSDQFVRSSHLKGSLSPAEVAQGWRMITETSGGSQGWQNGAVTNPINGSEDAALLLRLKAGETARLPLEPRTFELIGNVQIAPGTAGEIRYPVTVKSPDGTSETCIGSYRLHDDRSLEERRDDDPMLMGSLTGQIASRNLTFDGPKYIYYGDSWRRFEIVVKDNAAAHWLNSVKVVEYYSCAGLEPAGAADEGILELRIDSGEAVFRTFKFRTEQ